MTCCAKDPKSLKTAPVVAAGLIGGWQIARATGIRPIGGVVLAAAGVLAGRSWLARKGPATTAALSAGYLAAFGLSHPLAKRIGAWPSVLVVTSAITAAAHYLGDRN
ncbi:hypothetical protein [Acidipropionibacterium jensenii]|uniref:Uncharacterized protein n=1 Tax=Acidipropionibacterium jensenii TaxID=1749 RepID=A0A3Q9UPU8_9ACTN|nr:hypothetical protein [Acidipropionibacterium jensenii]AZZ42866.1 hypothetical protein C0Z11_11800 [Acidipropionibacterium jensenii]MDN5978362.1 hypothetical protein [Acidipropionibacterium jensenii]MDN5996616.1 hypothetical protein [Acidipropionibacterium jensenii]MDN6426926.1 hypothetical protein [Acidipropionibacterium jensenii]MDN6481554.1 hypothetical protein [Acidipropionibacterium jensenii]